MTRKAKKLLFHSPCFDGIVSAVIALDYLRRQAAWHEIEIEHVNYDRRETWLLTRFDQPTAIVDFLYHPDATFWADHHDTSFLNDALERDYSVRRSDQLIYDRHADSCAGLLWRRLSHPNARYAELVHWAEKIDGARYESVEEALSFDEPAMQISATLTVGSNGYSERLVKLLTERSLDEVAAAPDVKERFAAVALSMRAGLERVECAATLRDDIITFDIDAGDLMIPRYAAWRVFPRARYSVGVVRHDDRAKITAMRNPWMEFESVPLGEIFAPHGGGGHQRVASLNVSAGADARAILARIVAEVAAADRAGAETARR